MLMFLLKTLQKNLFLFYLLKHNKDKIEAIINVSGTVTETINHTLNITYDFRNINKDYADKLIEIAKKKGIMDFNTLYTESNLQP